MHTVFPKQTFSAANAGPRLAKTTSVDDKLENQAPRQLKRAKLDSISSESGLNPDGDVEPKEKRIKLAEDDETNESSTTNTIAD